MTSQEGAGGAVQDAGDDYAPDRDDDRDDDRAPDRAHGTTDEEPDEGAGTVLAIGLVAVVCSLVIACAGLGAAVIARHRAAAAADLAALAGADRALGRTDGAPCPAAQHVAHANGGLLTSCAVSPDGTVTVAVLVRLPEPWTSLGPARARARAGRPPSIGPAHQNHPAPVQPTVMASSKRLMKSEARTGG